MRYFIIAKSREGWGVALDSDLLAEFTDLDGAQAFAGRLCETATFQDPDFEVLDLSEAEGEAMFMASEPHPH